MKTKFVALFVALLSTAGGLLAQDASGSGTSLGDLARQQRARRMKVMQEKSVRIWSNENIPRRPASEGPTAARGMSAVPAPMEPTGGQDAAPPPSTESASSAEAGGSDAVHDEQYYRKRMTELRDRRDLHQRQLAVLQQKQSQGQLQYYADPNKTLEQEFSRSDINKGNDEISQKEKEIAADEQAMQDLQDQLRREGHPAGWLR